MPGDIGSSDYTEARLYRASIHIDTVQCCFVLLRLHNTKRQKKYNIYFLKTNTTKFCIQVIPEIVGDQILMIGVITLLGLHCLSNRYTIISSLYAEWLTAKEAGITEAVCL